MFRILQAVSMASMMLLVVSAGPRGRALDYRTRPYRAPPCLYVRLSQSVAEV